jgi:pantetheine-phosphate adenylyltransferase
MNQKIIFPGSFDPITKGHLDIIVRASALFSEVVVAVAENTTGKRTIFSFEERLRLVQESIGTMPRVSVKGFRGLLVSLYQTESAHALVRGIRSTSDFEYESQLAQINQQLLPGIETIFLSACAPYLFVSASMVREVALLGGEIDAFVPDVVAQALKRWVKSSHLAQG